MENTELAVFRQCKDSIFAAVARIRQESFKYRDVPSGDIQDFLQQMLEQAPAVLLEHFHTTLEDEDKVRGFLFKFFQNRLRDVAKAAFRRKRRHIQGEDGEKLIYWNTLFEVEYSESAESLNCAVLEEVLKLAPKDVQALCRAYITCGDWHKATRHLGWSLPKGDRVKVKVRNFFAKNCKFTEGILIFVPMKG